MTKEERIAYYREMNKRAPKGAVVFAGSSLMEMFPIEAYAANLPVTVINRGVGGFVTDELLENLDTCILDLKPSKLFINIGTNDLGMAERTVDDVMDNYAEILRRVIRAVPDVRVTLMAYYPANYNAAPPEVKPWIRIRNNDRIREANRQAQALAERFGFRFIDVNGPLTDERGNLRAEYTIEGVHIKEEGYRAIYPLVEGYILDDL